MAHRGWVLPATLAIGFATTPLSARAQTPADLDPLVQEHAGDSPVPSGAAESRPTQAVSAAAVSYGTHGDAPIEGYLARPDGIERPLPGLIVIHEWWGLNDNIRAMTQRLAGEGYVALAVDLYLGQVAETPEGAMSLMQAANEVPERVSSNLEQALSFVVEANGGAPIGAIGWCFGGGHSLQLSLSQPEAISATVIYYGHLVTDAERLDALNAPVLGLFGSEDSFITPELVRQFEQALNTLGKSVEVHIYEGANHAFANPSGERYQADAAEDAWRRTNAFLTAHLR